MKPFRMGRRLVGQGHPCLVIAEAGVNHNGSLRRALEMVDTAALAGADAIKFQTFQTERLVTRQAPKAAYQKKAGRPAESQFEMLKKLELSPSDHACLMQRCQRRGLLFLSTPFDEESADMLAELGVPAFKAGSGDLTNLPLLRHLARKKLPLILSTGMSHLAEIRQAVKAIRAAGNPPLILLHCVSNYPAAPEGVNLRAMRTLEREFRVPAGFSDHTEGIEIALAAVAIGAVVIEKHFTLNRHLPGPDHKASIEPAELHALARGIRKIELALGDGRKAPLPAERAIAAVARRSLVAACDIPAGVVLAAKHLAVKRPGTGIPPAGRLRLLGRKTRQFIREGTLLAMEMLQ